jgi:hypothetical protein
MKVFVCCFDSKDFLLCRKQKQTKKKTEEMETFVSSLAGSSVVNSSPALSFLLLLFKVSKLPCFPLLPGTNRKHWVEIGACDEK